MKEIMNIEEPNIFDNASGQGRDHERFAIDAFDDSGKHGLISFLASINISMEQIIDLDIIAAFLENFSKLSQVSCELFDIDGKLFYSSQQGEINNKFRGNHIGYLANCQKNQDSILRLLFEKDYHEFPCENGLTDIVMPVHIHGRLLGAFFIGPFIKTANIINIFSGLNSLIKSIALNKLTIEYEIAEKAKLKEEIRLAQLKAEESDKLKSAFLANMSHEIRTPMNSIIGFSELLNRESLSNEDRATFISIIRESGHNLLELIDDIIDLARIEADQINIRRSVFDVNELMTELQSLFKEKYALVNKSDIELILNFSNEDSLLLYSDRLRIKQILSNLLRNAYKFSDRGTIQFGCNKQGDELLFYVKDSGIGIRIEQQEYIFDRFRQGENNLNRKFGGAGLGLSIAKDLCNLLGGDLWVESEFSSGSVFYLNLKHEINSAD